VLFALMLLLAPLAVAQQPFTTDDADVTARGKFHFEFSNSYDLLQRSALPAVRQNTVSFEIGYGLLEGVEIGVEMPLITIFNARDTTPRRITGIGDTNLAVKYNFRREREGSRVPAFALSGNIEVPTGSVSRGLGSGIADYSINGIAQKSLTNRTTLRGNLGVIFSGNTATGALGLRARGTVLTGGASIVRRFNERLYFGAEITGARANNLDLGADQLQFQVGGNYFLQENFSLDFSMVAGRKAADPRVGGQLGFAVDF
jgi:hypothetical protein